jgi:hypothetical protein
MIFKRKDTLKTLEIIDNTRNLITVPCVSVRSRDKLCPINSTPCNPLIYGKGEGRRRKNNSELDNLFAYPSIFNTKYRFFPAPSKHVSQYKKRSVLSFRNTFFIRHFEMIKQK